MTSVVNHAEFGKAVLEVIKKKYHAESAKPGPKEGFVQEQISLSVHVFAPSTNVKDPCCVCVESSPGVYVCTGDCCSDVLKK